MPEIQKISLSSGGEVAVRTAGDVSKPALVLLHGFPNSSRMFSDVTARLSGTVYVVAPDLPGFGASDLPPEPSFDMLANAIEELLASLNVGRRLLYLHDFGAPVAFQLAMRAPELVEGLIIQNANAHRSGFGPQWAATLDFWAAPNAGNEEAATAHLTLEGTRDQYVAGCHPRSRRGSMQSVGLRTGGSCVYRDGLICRRRCWPTTADMSTGLGRWLTIWRSINLEPCFFGVATMSFSTLRRFSPGSSTFLGWRLTSSTQAISFWRRRGPGLQS
ncbi:alpha/beta hydrolase [Mesorhizobium sp. M0491]|uniref:alpha/beta fold hydrolase n=1 Tax=Mesorhizobium sp. M0491 TaxID=2956950 RepID=UPI00333DD79D